MASDGVELRGIFPRDLIAVVDAVSIARAIPRTELVAEILHAWAVNRVHESNVIQKVTHGNPPLVEARRHCTEAHG